LLTINNNSKIEEWIIKEKEDTLQVEMTIKEEAGQEVMMTIEEITIAVETEAAVEATTVAAVVVVEALIVAVAEPINKAVLKYSKERKVVNKFNYCPIISSSA
jgi:hypothetical protein